MAQTLMKKHAFLIFIVFSLFIYSTEGKVAQLETPHKLSLSQMAKRSDLIIKAEILDPGFIEEETSDRPENAQLVGARISKVQFFKLKDIEIKFLSPLLKKSAISKESIKVIKNFELEIVDQQKYAAARGLSLVPGSPMPGEASPDYFDSAHTASVPFNKPFLFFLVRSKNRLEKNEFQLVGINTITDSKEWPHLSSFLQNSKGKHPAK